MWDGMFDGMRWDGMSIGMWVGMKCDGMWDGIWNGMRRVIGCGMGYGTGWDVG